LKVLTCFFYKSEHTVRCANRVLALPAGTAGRRHGPVRGASATFPPPPAEATRQEVRFTKGF
jgi:hypothetical protein